jgi:hypothetical protein
MGVLTWNDIGMTQRAPAFDGRRVLRVRVGNQGDGAHTGTARAKATNKRAGIACTALWTRRPACKGQDPKHSASATSRTLLAGTEGLHRWLRNAPPRYRAKPDVPPPRPPALNIGGY